MKNRVAVVGAGVAGLVSAIDLARMGVEVVVFDRLDGAGGKMKAAEIDGHRVDAGPTVLTMRWVFDELFEEAGESLGRRLKMAPAETLARHAWESAACLDLFSDASRSAEAIGEFAGAAEARRYLRFTEDTERIYRTLEKSFLRAVRPSPIDLVRSAGFRGLGDLWQIRPFESMWKALGRYFEDPRLRQLFARYATYVGSSPLASPATLMLIAHVEREGVWLVEGGLDGLARTLELLARKLGVEFRYQTDVERIETAGDRATAAVLGSGERVEADAVVLNADAQAVASGLFGSAIRGSAPRARARHRSLSAVTWTLLARTDGFPLARHNVFFSQDGRREFETLFDARQMPPDPTVYVCAQDREGPFVSGRTAGPERLLCLINAPATGGEDEWGPDQIETCEQRAFTRLLRSGLTVEREGSPERRIVRTPADWAQRFPGSAGALYGRNAHGWLASFQRPGPRTKIRGLYLASGCTHPGPGVPMAALAGRQAAAVIRADLASTLR